MISTPAIWAHSISARPAPIICTTGSPPTAGAPVSDAFHQTLGTLNGVQQIGVETLPRMRYRARLGWSNGPISVVGFMNYQSHFFNTQAAPPNVNFACTTAGGTVGGGTIALRDQQLHKYRSRRKRLSICRWVTIPATSRPITS